MCIWLRARQASQRPGRHPRRRRRRPGTERGGGAALTFAKLLPQNAIASSLVTEPSPLVSILSKKLWLGPGSGGLLGLRSHLVDGALQPTRWRLACDTDHPCVHAWCACARMVCMMYMCGLSGASMSRRLEHALRMVCMNA